MKLRAGIIGPIDSVNLIMEIAEEYNEQLNPHACIYEDPKEATRIIKENENRVDVWILAGPALYKAIQESGTKKPYYLLQLDGASLTKTLVEMSYNHQKNLERVSIDMLAERDIFETYRDLTILSDDVYFIEYTNETPLEELLSFHQKHYKEGKVESCITCLRSIQNQLQLQGIPAYWITPTRTNIRETLSTAIQKWETMHFKQSQIAAIVLRVQGMTRTKELNTYDLHRLNLEIQSAVLSFAESISGSFVSVGTESFLIFSTRGSLSNTEQTIGSLLEKLALITDSPSNIGIGYGETALIAEDNARLALNHATNFDAFCAFLVDDNGTIEGPLMEEEMISFGYRSENKEINEKLKNSGISITTYNKVLSVQNRMGNGSITAAHIAEWLKMTPRNARRILTGLVDEGLAEVIGEEAPTTKGRPRKIYRLFEPESK